MTRIRHPRSTALPGALRALADPTRLRMLRLLEGKRRTVGEIVKAFALSQPTISRHLQTLTAAGLVERRREAQSVYYETHARNVGTVCVALAEAFPRSAVTVRRTAPRPNARRLKKPSGRMAAKKRPKA